MAQPAQPSSRAEPPAPDVESRRTRLRNITPTDIDFLYGLSTDPRIGYTWRFRGGTPSPDEFQAQLWVGSFAQFVIETRAERRPIGQVAAYEAQPSNGHCKVAVLGAEQDFGSGLAIEGLALFISYLFTNWPFRKLYAEVPDFTFTRFATGLGRYFVEEGRLRAHTYYRGKWWDVRLIAIYQAAWEPAHRRLFGYSEAGGDAAGSVDENVDFETLMRVLLVDQPVDTNGLSQHTTLEELGLDSLSVLELEMVLVDLGIEFPPDLLVSLRTLGDLHYYCQTHLAHIKAGKET